MIWWGKLAANDVANSQRTVNKADPCEGGVVDDQQRLLVRMKTSLFCVVNMQSYTSVAANNQEDA